MDRADAQMIGQEVAAALRANSTSSNLGGSKSTEKSSSGVGLPDITGYAGKFLDSLGQLTVGTYKAANAMNDAGYVFSQFGEAGSALGKFTSGVGQFAIGMNDSMKDVSKHGYTFGQNLGLYDQAVTSARMSLPEFQDMVRRSGKDLAGLGTNANTSGLMFLSMGKMLQEDDFANKLKITGLGAEELTETMRISSMNRRFQDMTDVNSRMKAVDAAIAMATEMDNVARLTGKSRQEQEKSIEAQMKKNETEIALMAMTEDETASYEANNAMMERYGKNFQDLLTAESTGGIRTKEDTAKAAAVGPAMMGYIRELAAIKGNSPEDDARRRQIREQMDLEALRMGQNKEELKTRAALATAGGEYGRQQAETVVGMKGYIATLQNQKREADKMGISLGEYQKQQEERIAKERAAAGTGKGPEGPAALPAQTINAADTKIKDLSAGLGVGFAKLNTEVGNSLTQFTNLNNFLRTNFTTEQMVGKAERLANRIGTSPISGPIDESKVVKPKKEATQHDEGTKAVWGDWFPKEFTKGMEVKVDPSEAIVPKRKLPEFFNDMAGSLGSNMGKMPEMMQNMIGKVPGSLTGVQSEMSNVMAKAKASMPTMDGFKDMFGSGMPGTGPSVSMPSMPKTGMEEFTSSTSKSESSVMNDMAKGIDGLNMRIEKLIAAVEHSGDKSVKAIKSKGNMVA